MKKRSQANIITITLSVLIVLVLLIILWNIVKIMIRTSSEEISIKQLPYIGNTNLKYRLENDNKTIIISVSRDKGGEDITGIKFIFYTSDEKRYNYTNRTALIKEFETRIYNISSKDLNPQLNDFTYLVKIDIYYLYIDTNGKEKTTTVPVGSGGKGSGNLGGGNSGPGPNDPCSPNPCINSHGQPGTCNNGNCDVPTCDSNWGNCDNINSNGCESDLTASEHCGTCSNNCGISSCVNGICDINDCYNSAINPIPICTCNDLNKTRLILNANYILMNNIDCTNTINWNNGAGFFPIPKGGITPFSGTFDGDGFVIKNLFIKGNSSLIGQLYGLFAWVSGTIKNVGLVNETIVGTNGSETAGGFVGSYTGGLVADNDKGNITNCYSILGFINGDFAGGLVGFNWKGIINNSYTNTTINGSLANGGIVANNWGMISSSYFSGNITGKVYFGGINGLNYQNITNCFVSAKINSIPLKGGGIAGNNTGSIKNSYWDKKPGSTLNCYPGGNTGCVSIDNNEPYFYTITNSPINSWNFPPWGKINDGTYYPVFGKGYTDCYNSAINPIPICTCNDLNKTRDNLAANYELNNDIDCTDTINWNNGAGFIPIGNSSLLIGDNSIHFTGIFDGKGKKIINLYIKRSNSSLALFASNNGSIKHLSLVNAFINCTKSTALTEIASGIVAWNFGNITDCFFNGTVNSQDSVSGIAGYNDIQNSFITNCNSYGKYYGGNFYSGGLVGINNGFIINSYSSVNISGVSLVGGLVGYNNFGTIINSISTGVALGDSDVGGIAGKNYGMITGSSSSSDVSGRIYIGGLIGENGKGYINGISGLVANSYSTGNVYGSSNVGGLIGFDGTGNISYCHSSSFVNGVDVNFNDRIGGLIGSSNNGNIKKSYSTGNVIGSNTNSGTNNIGGFIGYNTGNISDCYSTSLISGTKYVGGFVGDNEGKINFSYSTGDVTGNDYVGGNTGMNGGKISDSFSTGKVIASSHIGGFIGGNWNNVNNCYWNFRTGDSYPCIGVGTTTGCTIVSNNLPYFYSISNPPINSWSFPPWSNINNGINFPVFQ